MDGRDLPRGADDASVLRFWDRHVAEQGGWAPLYGEDDPVP
jgi:hypothetical protein